jgi:hypothetical protein
VIVTDIEEGGDEPTQCGHGSLFADAVDEYDGLSLDGLPSVGRAVTDGSAKSWVVGRDC